MDACEICGKAVFTSCADDCAGIDHDHPEPTKVCHEHAHLDPVSCVYRCEPCAHDLGLVKEV